MLSDCLFGFTAVWQGWGEITPFEKSNSKLIWTSSILISFKNLIFWGKNPEYPGLNIAVF
jgi:hypothetical protein